MSNLTELTAQVITARASRKDMSTEEFQQEMLMVYSFLKGIEFGDSPVTVPATQEAAEDLKPQLTIKQAFRKDEIICMICSKSFKTLKRHLAMAHQLKPGEYRKQFGIPATQSLAAKSYSESRRKMAIDKGLGEGLASFRAAEKARKIAVTASMANVPVVKEKAAVPAIKKKPAVPVVKEKVAVPARVVKKR